MPFPLELPSSCSLPRSSSPLRRWCSGTPSSRSRPTCRAGSAPTSPGEVGLGAVAGRRGQVHPEGRRDPQRGRPDGVPLGARRCSDRDRPPLRHHPARSRPGGGRPRRRRVLRPRRFVARDHRRADGGLVVRQQVLVDRWPAGRRAAHRIRASTGPGCGRRRHPGGHHVAGRDRGCPGGGGVAVRDPADRRLRDLHDRLARRVEPDPVRHADRRVRVGDGLPHRVHAVSGSSSSSWPSTPTCSPWR